MIKNRKTNILRMTELAILTAIVLVLQLTGTVIKIPGGTSISLVLLPIVLGAVLLGPSAGAWLGLVFGTVTYLAGVTGADFFTNVLFTNHPLLTALVCFGKGICAGLVAGSVYKLLSGMKVNPYLAAGAAAAVAPIVNTGLFILGGLTMTGTLAANFADERGVMYFLIIGCAGFNFIFELILNLLLSPVIYRVSVIVKKSIHKNQTHM